MPAPWLRCGPAPFWSTPRAEALRMGLLAGAGLDVLEEEPLDPASPLGQMEQVIVTPHAAWYSEEGRSDLKRQAAEEAVRVLRGERPRHCVNAEVFRRGSGATPPG